MFPAARLAADALVDGLGTKGDRSAAMPISSKWRGDRESAAPQVRQQAGGDPDTAQDGPVFQEITPEPGTVSEPSGQESGFNWGLLIPILVVGGLLLWLLIGVLPNYWTPVRSLSEVDHDIIVSGTTPEALIDDLFVELTPTRYEINRPTASDTAAVSDPTLPTFKKTSNGSSSPLTLMVM